MINSFIVSLAKNLALNSFIVSLLLSKFIQNEVNPELCNIYFNLITQKDPSKARLRKNYNNMQVQAQFFPINSVTWSSNYQQDSSKKIQYNH
jgi:hypothetical protein